MIGPAVRHRPPGQAHRPLQGRCHQRSSPVGQDHLARRAPERQRRGPAFARRSRNAGSCGLRPTVIRGDQPVAGDDRRGAAGGRSARPRSEVRRRSKHRSGPVRAIRIDPVSHGAVTVRVPRRTGSLRRGLALRRGRAHRELPCLRANPVRRSHRPPRSGIVVLVAVRLLRPGLHRRLSRSGRAAIRLVARYLVRRLSAYRRGQGHFRLRGGWAQRSTAQDSGPSRRSRG
jgi:hypothetical protein